MIRAFAKHLAPVSALQLFLLAVSLVWCCEADCIGAGKSEDCGSLVCIVLSKESSSTRDLSPTTAAACSCVCHLKALPGAESFTSFVKALTPIPVVGLYALLDLPSEPIIRPPIAA